MYFRQERERKRSAVTAVALKSVIGVLIAAVIIGCYNWYHESELQISLLNLAFMFIGVFSGSYLYDLWKNRNRQS